MAAATYFANFIHWENDLNLSFQKHLEGSAQRQLQGGLLVGDVETFLESIGTIRKMLGGRELGLLAGGPPCQGFSLAGRRKPGDPRNELVWRFLDAAELLSPLLVLMENVDAIQRPFDKAASASVLPDLESTLQQTARRFGGYSVIRLALRADSYGVPQRRKRIFLLGVRKDLAIAHGIEEHSSWDSDASSPILPRPMVAPAVSPDRAPTTSEALWDLLYDDYAPLESAPSVAALEYARTARSEPHFVEGAPTTLDDPRPRNHSFRSHSAKTQTRFQLLRLFAEHGIRNSAFIMASTGRDGLERLLDPLCSILPIDIPMRRIETRGELVELVKSLSSLKHSQQALRPDAPSPTITTLPDDLCHYAMNRTLTVREVARLQSFPDSFLFVGKETTGGHKRQYEVPQYSQVGNAVPPLLAKALGRQLRQLLEELTSDAEGKALNLKPQEMTGQTGQSGRRGLHTMRAKSSSPTK